MKFKLLLIVVMFGYLLDAQESYYDLIGFGRFGVKYSDTVVFDPNVDYQQYGYSGKAPLFVQIWFPSKKHEGDSYLKFGDYNNRKVPEELKLVYDELCKQIDSSVVRDNIEPNIETEESIKYSNSSYVDVLKKMKLLSTISTKALFPINLSCPVIVYHHGAQGLSYENSIMAEFFASHGYVFVSSNFHLPFENLEYGSLPYDLDAANKQSQSNTIALLNFAHSINSGNKVFYVGHSWGAQQGWCVLHKTNLANAFISMETTIEYKSDTTAIKKIWPEVYEALSVNKNKLVVPVLMFAAVDNGLNFNYFKDKSTAQLICASYKKYFSHNSYTSICMMRFFLQSSINQPDLLVLKEQINGYKEHLDFMLTYFNAQCKGKKITTKKYLPSFKFTH